jgi:hypothetical protein
VPIAVLLHLTRFRMPVDANVRGDLQSVAGTAGAIVAFAAAVGSLTMATVEAVKRLTPARALFFRFLLDRILTTPGEGTPADLIAGARVLGGVRDARITRITRVTQLAWFDVPVEQFIAQLSAIAEQQLEQFARLVVIRNGTPRVQEQSGNDAPFEVLAMLLGYASADELTTWADKQLAEMPKDEGQPTKGDQNDGESAVRRGRSLLETALRAQLELELDRIHIVLGTSWRWVLRAASSLIAGIIAAAVLIAGGVGVGLVVSITAVAVVIGGFFSWMARDVVAIIERLRQ